uniref:DUF2738 superfamily protein n=2 Tax=Nucleocytoviricota sp. TaxID=2809609 RepID=A0A9E8G4K3_9VIRU|nr:DUF2738 superfamily protein [Nucleocytoviricota sp.]
MESSMIINGNMLTPDSDVMYKKPSINNNGGKAVGILNANSKKSLIISTPLMLTWGVNEYVDDKTGKKTYDMALQFPSDEYNTEQISAFLTSLQQLESKIKSDAVKNCKDWLGKQKVSDEVVDALWTPMLKYPKIKDSVDFDYSRPPTLKIKIPYWEGEFKTELYNDAQEQVFPLDDSGPIEEYISKGSNVATLIQCGGLWFANGKFGVTWKLVQAVVKPRPSIKGKCHIALSSDDREKINTVKPNSDEDSKLVEDSEDEDEDDDTPVDVSEPVKQSEPEPEPEQTAEPAPEPEKKKKVVRKKKSAED